MDLWELGGQVLGRQDPSVQPGVAVTTDGPTSQEWGG